MNLAGEEILLPFPGIRREFHIEEESADDKMLELVSSGLDYVKVLMPGDDLPSELLTGEAFWEITDAHRNIARQRISMQLVSWMSGDENLITDPDQLLQIADDPGVKEKINQAFSEAAKEIGGGDGDADMVIDMIEELAEELSYIETLRDQFRGVLAMKDKIASPGGARGGSRSRPIRRRRGQANAPVRGKKPKYPRYDDIGNETARDRHSGIR